ncbi:SRPBCC family protein [Microcella alkaliphila]|nr:SRPBCC domain-containing protein [Microcella alkaliphila]
MTDVGPSGFRSTRDIAAAPERVWEVLTTPSAFATWFGTDAVEVPLDRLTWRAVAGEPWSAQMVLPGGATIDWEGEMLTVDAPSILSFTITDDASIDQRDTVMFELAGAEANGCSLTLSQTGGGLDVDGYAQAAAGWAGFVDAIERLAAASR